ncbi:MAG: WG repeat-containing protein [Oscillospiraceae bacterium]
MKKRMLSALLTLCALLSLLPAAVAAEGDSGNFSDTNVTWIGAQAEYQKTIDNMYPSGLRRMKAGDKWGILDATGEWVAPPIYDKIELYFAKNAYHFNQIDRQATADPSNGDEPVQHIFIDGFTQCVRGGKMGLLSQYGEEVIPCQYDAVGLPSDGVSRIYQKGAGKSGTMGYWNLEQNREIVPPTKYGPISWELSDGHVAAGDNIYPGCVTNGNWSFGLPGDPEHLRLKGKIRDRVFMDFYEGYAFVKTSDGDKGLRFCMGTIIDKNGKVILPGGPYDVEYIYAASGLRTYPQIGPYLVYLEQADGYQYQGGSLPAYFKSGVMGPKGAVIPAQYTGGVVEPIGGSELDSANMQILLDLGLVVTQKDTARGKYNSGRFGAVNLKNQVVFPFQFYELGYDAKYHLFTGVHPSATQAGAQDADLYTTDGKKLTHDSYAKIELHNAENGYAPAKLNQSGKGGGAGKDECFVNVKTGEMSLTRPESPPTPAPYPKGQWEGLIQNEAGDYLGAEGKVIFPETLRYEGRINSVKQGTTLVVKNGKVGYISTENLARPTATKTPNPAAATAKPSPTKLLVNGKSVAASAYLIGQNNYVKLRDLAYLVNGTGKNFEVKWDDGKKAINLKSNTPYTTVTGDMTPAAGGAQTATRSGSTIYVDGLGRSLTAYTINGNNYFKLRDVMRVFDIAVGYDNATKTATLDTNQGYQRTDGEKAGMIPAPTEVEAPPAAHVSKLEILKEPKQDYYMNANPALNPTFNPTGFVLRYWDEKGTPQTITDTSQMEFKIEGKVIEEGHVFTTGEFSASPDGRHVGRVSYNGLEVPMYVFIYKAPPVVKVDPVPGATDKALPDGKYTLSVLGNTMGLSNSWAVLDSKNPVVVTVEKEGDYYYVFLAEGTRKWYIGVNRLNGQLATGFKEKWIIAHLGDDTYSMRQKSNLKMLVCSAAAAKKDGTKVMVWKNTKTPKHAIFTFTPAE